MHAFGPTKFTKNCLDCSLTTGFCMQQDSQGFRLVLTLSVVSFVFLRRCVVSGGTSLHREQRKCQAVGAGLMGQSKLTRALSPPCPPPESSQCPLRFRCLALSCRFWVFWCKGVKPSEVVKVQSPNTRQSCVKPRSAPAGCQTERPGQKNMHTQITEFCPDSVALK